MPRKRTRGSGVQLGEEVVRTMVLQGASKVFAAQGVRATGVQDILKAARISRRTFYRVYGSKEDVLLELYRLGTELLLANCRLALEQESDPLRQIERCVDAHLATAREQPRLVFVLGGEAHRQESLLHARRIEVHEALASMMVAHARVSLPRPPSRLLFRALLFAHEGVTRLVLEEGDEGRNVTAEAFERARAVMLRISTAAMAGEGIGVASMPEDDRPRPAVTATGTGADKKRRFAKSADAE
jgi:AcrR family transcriptional regulator